MIRREGKIGWAVALGATRAPVGRSYVNSRCRAVGKMNFEMVTSFTSVPLARYEWRILMQGRGRRGVKVQCERSYRLETSGVKIKKRGHFEGRSKIVYSVKNLRNFWIKL